MVQTLGITTAITNLNEAHDKFHLSPTADTQFFTEWFEDLPEITDREKESLNRLKNRYLYYAADGAITEGLANWRRRGLGVNPCRSPKPRRN